MKHSYFRQSSFIHVTQLIHTCHTTINTCFMAHSHVTHSCMWHDSSVYETWLIHVCDMTHSYVWHGSFTGDMTNSPLHMPQKNRLNWRIAQISCHKWTNATNRWMPQIDECLNWMIAQIACHKWITYMCYICISLLFPWNSITASCHMYEWRMPHKCVTNFIYLWDLTHSYIGHDLFIRVYVNDTTRLHMPLMCKREIEDLCMYNASKWVTHVIHLHMPFQKIEDLCMWNRV